MRPANDFFLKWLPSKNAFIWLSGCLGSCQIALLALDGKIIKRQVLNSCSPQRIFFQTDETKFIIKSINNEIHCYKI